MNDLLFVPDSYRIISYRVVFTKSNEQMAWYIVIHSLACHCYIENEKDEAVVERGFV